MWRALCADVIARYGAIDALVNNAGFGLWGPMQTLSDAELKAQFETNFFAAVRVTRAALPSMLERRGGIIVNVSSVLGRMGTPFNGAYAASKFALEGMSESLKTELQPFGDTGGAGGAGAVSDELPAQRIRGGGRGHKPSAVRRAYRALSGQSRFV